MVSVTDFPEDRLESEGWERRSILDDPRLSEVTASYEEMGLEVTLKDIDGVQVDECTSCLDGPTGRFMIVYTRPGKGPAKLDELFGPEVDG
jgi:hypothetical protein